MLFLNLEHLLFSADRSKLSIKYAPCEDKCKQIIQTNKEEEKIRTMGKRLKLSYINAARNLPQKEVRIHFYLYI